MSSQPQSGLPPSDAPPVQLTAHDLARLDAMLESDTYRHHPGAAALQRELDRADVLPDSAPSESVGMQSRVSCVDEDSGIHHRFSLVYPHEADVDVDAGRVSILAPVGTALLGLRVGQRIDWPVANRRTLRLRVMAVAPADAS
ncbi:MULTISPECIES: nucleoside diphosphate kinase regulator [Luteimonas]|uniref:nucleoside diphosphate kinase regulator n=1 Tax=Luteimonas TaxID=83614 RepID=UPI000C7B2D32|nr:MULTISPECIES: nucleoside diphosphate kinase regulator [Luteimonas]